MTRSVLSVVLNVISGLANSRPEAGGTLSNSSSQVASAITASQNHSAGVCYATYGCFPMDYPWVSDHRPVAFPPLSPTQMQAKAVLYLPQKPNWKHEMRLENSAALRNAPYDFNLPFKLVVHGFLSSLTSSWTRNIRHELVQHGGYNIVMIGWNAIPPYPQAVANTRLVGVMLGHYVGILIRDLKVKPRNIHVIGHSLGSHIAGYAGSYLKSTQRRTIGRITALDPAGPYFHDPNPRVRLNKEDAKFVDVIHTDETSIFTGLPFSFGNPQYLGHLDFYPNGGVRQPGCSDSMTQACHHRRAYKLFVESIRQECSFTAISCESYEKFMDGECWGCSDEHPCNTMGFHAEPSSKKHHAMFLNTWDTIPFCGTHYRISVESRNSSEAHQNEGEVAQLSVQLIGSSGSTSFSHISNKPLYYKAGSIKRRVVLHEDVGQISRVRVKVRFPFYSSFMRFFNPIIYMKAVHVEKLGSDERSSFCFSDVYQTARGDAYVLLKDDNCGDDNETSPRPEIDVGVGDRLNIYSRNRQS